MIWLKFFRKTFSHQVVILLTKQYHHKFCMKSNLTFSIRIVRIYNLFSLCRLNLVTPPENWNHIMQADCHNFCTRSFPEFKTNNLFSFCPYILSATSTRRNKDIHNSIDPFIANNLYLPSQKQEHPCTMNTELFLFYFEICLFFLHTISMKRSFHPNCIFYYLYKSNYPCTCSAIFPRESP